VVTEPEAVEAAQSQPGAIEIGEAAAFLCRERARCKVLHGGRGGLKSWSAARTLLLAGVDRTLRILCAREFQNSIADSVHRLLADQIGLMGLGNFYQVQNCGSSSPRNVTLLPAFNFAVEDFAYRLVLPSDTEVLVLVVVPMAGNFALSTSSLICIMSPVR